MKQIAVTFEQAKRIDLLAVLREIDFGSFQFTVFSFLLGALLFLATVIAGD